jgi:hypothetical protein
MRSFGGNNTTDSSRAYSKARLFGVRGSSSFEYYAKETLRTKSFLLRLIPILIDKSAALQLLESSSDQAAKLLRVRGVSLHPVLSELRLNHQDFLRVLCVADLSSEGESRLGIVLGKVHGAVLNFLETNGHGI